jgi:hypothetical protein
VSSHRSGAHQSRRIRRRIDISVRGRGHAGAWHEPAPLPVRTRPVTGLRTDGGTAFCVWSDGVTWNERLQMTVDALLAAHARDDLDPEELADMQLPLPCLPGGDAPGLSGLLVEDGRLFVDWRTRGFGTDDGFPVAQVHVQGRSIVFHFRDRAFCRLMQRRDLKSGQFRWYLRVEAKHRELYSRDVGPWMETWLGYWSWLLFGEWTPVHRLRGLHGWTTTQWHVNCDYVGLTFSSDDSPHFVGPRDHEVIGGKDEDDPGFSRFEARTRNDEDDDEPLNWAQTLVFGRKTSDVMVVGYKKGDQLRQAKKIDPSASAYAVHWRARGWDPKVDGDPFRIEVRTRKKGLVYRELDSERIAYDFRDPALLCDDAAVRSYWAHVTGQRRLVTRAPICRACEGTGRTRVMQRECRRCDGRGRCYEDRVTRCPTDPRWCVVQSAAELDERPEIRQMPHEVAEKTRAERVAFDQWQLLRAAQHYMADRYGTVFHSSSDVAAVFKYIGEDFEAHIAGGTFDPNNIGERIFAHPKSLEKEAKRCVARVQLFLGELTGLHDELEPRLRELGGDGGQSIFELCGPPAPLIDDNTEQETGT